MTEGDAAPVRVKVTYAHRHLDLVRDQTAGGRGRVGRYEFIANQQVDACDWWVVCENVVPGERAVVPRENVVLLTWEAPERRYEQAFVDQFAAIFTCHDEIAHPNVRIGPQGHTWHLLGRTYDDLAGAELPPKERELSIVTSSKAFLPGHVKRLELAMALRDHFGARIDFFGQGFQPVEHKWDALAPYRYSVAIENSVKRSWITEKVTDCFLAGTVPFYAGAPDLGEHYPSASFVPIDLDDHEQAIRTIEAELADDGAYERRRSAVAEAKRRHLEELSLFPLLARYLDELAATRGTTGPPAEVRLEPEHAPPTLLARAVGKLRQVIRR